VRGTPYPALTTTSMRPSSANARSTTARTAAVSLAAVSLAASTGVKRLRIAVEQVGDLAGIANRADDPVAAVERLLGQLAAGAAADPGDEPGTRGHC
jgi:hypothetical protein